MRIPIFWAPVSSRIRADSEQANSVLCQASIPCKPISLPVCVSVSRCFFSVATSYLAARVLGVEREVELPAYPLVGRKKKVEPRPFSISMYRSNSNQRSGARPMCTSGSDSPAFQFWKHFDQGNCFLRERKSDP